MLRRLLILLLALCSLRQLLAADPNAPPRFQAEPDEAMNALFQQRDGWIGADGDYTVPLGDGRTLWMFSDTWVGKIRDGKRTDATMVNNTAAIQEGKDKDAKVKFFVRHDAVGKPLALFSPDDGHGWFWPMAGIRVDKKLYLFLAQVERTEDPGAFGFRGIGQWLGVVDNPDADPIAWHIKQQKLPFVKFSPKRELNFGTAVVRDGNDVYVFGTDDDRRTNTASRYLVVARVPAEKLADFSAWRFFTKGDWVADADSCERLFDGMATESSVTFVPCQKQYVCVYTEGGMSAKILARTAPVPWGPWSKPATVYQCPEAGWDKRIFCYAAKAHGELSDDGELLITYAANSVDFSQVAGDARLYWPRFVKAKLFGN